MWIIDAWAARRMDITNHVEEMTLPQAIWIGLCQSLSAIFPGTSRSMSTIAAGQLVGMSRPAALEFSFLLSIPTMIAATLWDLLKELHPGHGQAAHVVMNSQNWIVLIIGFVVSFIVALWRSRVVPHVGPQARLHPLRHLPHPPRLRSTHLRSQIPGQLTTSKAVASEPSLSIVERSQF